MNTSSGLTTIIPAMIIMAEPIPSRRNSQDEAGLFEDGEYEGVAT